MATQTQVKELGMRDLSCETISAELKAAIVYGDDMPPGVIRRAAIILKCSEWTLRDVLEGRIKPRLEHLHAFSIASEFHPAVIKFLEPDGSRLSPLPDCGGVKEPEQEITDVIISASSAILAVRQALEDGRITKQEKHQIRICLNDMHKQVAEVDAAVERLGEPKPRVVGLSD